MRRRDARPGERVGVAAINDMKAKQIKGFPPGLRCSSHRNLDGHATLAASADRRAGSEPAGRRVVLERLGAGLTEVGDRLLPHPAPDGVVGQPFDVLGVLIVLGAVVITWLQVSLSDFTTAWQLYLGVFFIVMVLFAPGGLAGLVANHVAVARSGRLHTVIPSYLLMLVPGVESVEVQLTFDPPWTPERIQSLSRATPSPTPRSKPPRRDLDFCSGNLISCFW